MIPILIDGIVYGLQLSLLAVGLTLIFGLGGVLNIAHGQFAVIAALTTWWLMGKGVATLAAVVLGVIAAGVVGLLVDRSLLLPAYKIKGEARLLLGLLLTLGLTFISEGYINYRYPNADLSLRLPVLSVNLFGMTIRTASIVTALVAIVIVLALLLFLKGTRVGKAIRSIIQNEVGAELCGINPVRIRTLIFFIGASIAGVVGMTQALTASVGPERGFELTIFALIVTTVGGVRSINGTLAAGVLLGVVHAFTSFYVGAYVTFIVLLATAVFTLLVRPTGLLGRWT